MLNKTVSRTQIYPLSPAARHLLPLEFSRNLPPVPVLPETFLLLDFMVQERSVDLRQMAHVVLADIGATLQILRLVGHEYGDAEGRPVRIEDCISDLGLEACLKAVSARTVAHDASQPAILAFWAHAKEVARHAKGVAEEMTGIAPDQAYLAGLFHGIDLLPHLLGWREAGAAEGALAGLRLAQGWSLPQCVTDLFSEMSFPGYATPWSEIVQNAHLRATRSSVHSPSCPFERDLHPHLHPHLHPDGYGQPIPASLL